MEPKVTDPARGRSSSSVESRLLARFRDGEHEHFGALVRPHLGSLAALSRRVVADDHWAEDLLQETLLRAYRGLDGFRGEAELRTWLFRILIRLSSEPSRWRKRERAPTLVDVEIPDTLGPAPDAPAIDRELQDRMQEAMERLTARQRTALHLRAVEGMDYRRIAAALGCKEAAARMHVLEARRKIMHRIGRHLQ